MPLFPAKYPKGKFKKKWQDYGKGNICFDNPHDL